MNSIFFAIFFLFYLTDVFAQTTVIIQKDEIGNKYLYNPFTNLMIKPNAFKDGSYIFYADSTKANLLFNGTINNGTTNGA